ncbi:MAG TPA: hypothetical protein PK530_14640 [Anaerolineales bacterium]|nr:hypothetical protein [Anaerolineales bacterium]
MSLNLAENTISHPPARRVAPADLTSSQANKLAQTILTGGLSSSAWQMLDRLAMGGVLGTWQLCQPPLSARAIRNYASQYLITRLPFQSAQLEAAFQEYGLFFAPETSLYILGPVGVEIVKMRHETTPLTGYLAYPLKRIMHDVLTNEIILRIATSAQASGWQATWLNKYEATLAQEGQAVLEPDGMVRLRKGEAERLFCVEYHNEDHQTRAWQKVTTYESVFHKTELWQKHWDTEEFPKVLAVFAKPIVSKGYEYSLKNRESQRVQYYGKLLIGVLTDQLPEWKQFGTGVRENLWG